MSLLRRLVLFVAVPALVLLLALVPSILSSRSPQESAEGSYSPGPSSASPLALGVWSGQPWEPGNLDAVTSLLGRAPAVFLTYQSWASRDFHASDMQEIAGRGAAQVVTWEPDGFALPGIASGEDDTYIRNWARGAAQWGGTIYLRPMHEMNGDWYSWGRGVNGNTPDDFIGAWRHMHDIFQQEGATNVKWVWSPNVRYANQYPIADLYPGDDDVDWVGLDGYNWGSDPHLATPAWQSFSAIFGATYDEITQHVAPGKPVMVVETGSTEHGGSKADWIRQALLQQVPSYRQIRAVIWFNESDGPSDFRIDSSPASLAAFKQVVNSDLFSGRLP